MIAGRAHMHVPRLMTGIIGKKKNRNWSKVHSLRRGVVKDISPERTSEGDQS